MNDFYKDLVAYVLTAKGIGVGGREKGDVFTSSSCLVKFIVSFALWIFQSILEARCNLITYYVDDLFV